MRKKFLIVLLLSALISGGVWISGKAQASIVINLNFDYVRQGGVGVISLSGPEIVGGVLSAFDRTYPFFPSTGGFQPSERAD